jgi:hypothetical protein
MVVEGQMSGDNTSHKEKNVEFSEQDRLNIFLFQRWRLPFWIVVIIGSGFAKALLPRSGDIALLSIPVLLAIVFMIGEFVTRLATKNIVWTWQQDCVMFGFVNGTTMVIAVIMLAVSLVTGKTENLFNRWGSYMLGELIALNAFSIVYWTRVRKDWRQIRIKTMDGK